MTWRAPAQCSTPCVSVPRDARHGNVQSQRHQRFAGRLRSILRRSVRRILLLMVFGRSATNSISPGVLVGRGDRLHVLLQLAAERFRRVGL